ncbi:Exodeoxyribonuclease VII small subunit [Candidatus Kryptonium thompsonii]|jgi:exodeoxyribonuclease VII small subunit|uniref:Exodeoxyribonuclease 7 small subunit n=1 Tax=Candidatus Kryptonium thompsonii TaxID=1633631 RepID=A0A0P1LWM3_9BACT|nr:exodeoxyribonuclease VII small subunit [Candidatus Kryptonium thompsoni]CUS85251.1 Exodeoxyribonuclease VII small subunit [Candidatus Kryptonium thompsoni]CUS86308.1 Exodeoxyribonuclease VII small subunit [Candidatus Kryptonium thompsoni]CUS87233.1 Exodeoxyribonuclease VII small subunit [Candidatus Kryptonium thompsoni]CUS98524.1 Exodeoxyribonuclease VII small subunit [Candidatus Kryptonium thompsoni]CUS99303.1 Exodeoxyribonuclease VII small subunit [Candidatus Kryptonium thompsoni]
MAKKNEITESSLENLTFEQALKELQNIVDKLETGQVTLEEAIEMYERGIKLSKYCLHKLTQAELRIKKIIKDESQGFTLIDFDDFNNKI